MKLPTKGLTVGDLIEQAINDIFTASPLIADDEIALIQKLPINELNALIQNKMSARLVDWKKS